MYDAARTDEIGSFRVEETAWKDVKVISFSIRLDGMPCIVSTLCAAYQFLLRTEDIHQFALKMYQSIVVIRDRENLIPFLHHPLRM